MDIGDAAETEDEAGSPVTVLSASLPPRSGQCRAGAAVPPTAAGRASGARIHVHCDTGAVAPKEVTDLWAFLSSDHVAVEMETNVDVHSEWLHSTRTRAREIGSRAWAAGSQDVPGGAGREPRDKGELLRTVAPACRARTEETVNSTGLRTGSPAPAATQVCVGSQD